MNHPVPAEISTENLINAYAAATGMRPGRWAEYVYQTLGISESRFWQLLIRATRTPELLELALAHDPITTNRIINHLDRQTQARRNRAHAIKTTRSTP